MIARPPFANSLEGGFRTEPVQARKEVRSDEDGEVAQLLSCDPERRQPFLEHQKLGRHAPRSTESRQELCRLNCKESNQSGSTEEKRVVVLRTRGPHIPPASQESRLGLLFGSGLARWD